jgi:hypothetical protein
LSDSEKSVTLVGAAAAMEEMLVEKMAPA